MALLEVGFFSEVLGMCTRMSVILPQTAPGMIGVDTPSQQQKWKVLYLLHGLSDDHTIWERRTSIERYVSDLPLAVIVIAENAGWGSGTAASTANEVMQYFSENYGR